MSRYPVETTRIAAAKFEPKQKSAPVRSDERDIDAFRCHWEQPIDEHGFHCALCAPMRGL